MPAVGPCHGSLLSARCARSQKTSKSWKRSTRASSACSRPARAAPHRRSRAPEPLAVRRAPTAMTISIVLSGWNCVPRCGPLTKACAPAGDVAINSCPGRSGEALVVPLQPRPRRHQRWLVGVDAVPAELRLGRRARRCRRARPRAPGRRSRGRAPGCPGVTARSMKSRSAATDSTSRSCGLCREPNDADETRAIQRRQRLAVLSVRWTSSPIPRALAQSPSSPGGPVAVLQDQPGLMPATTGRSRAVASAATVARSCSTRVARPAGAGTREAAGPR